MKTERNASFADLEFNPAVGLAIERPWGEGHEKPGYGLDLEAMHAEADKPGGRLTLRDAFRIQSQRLEEEWEKPVALAKQGLPYRPRVYCELPHKIPEYDDTPNVFLDILELARSTPNVDWILKLPAAPCTQLALESYKGKHLWPQANIWLAMKVCCGPLVLLKHTLKMLLCTPATKRVLIVDAENHRIRMNSEDLVSLDWVIGLARTIHTGATKQAKALASVRALRDMCASSGVPFWFQGWEEWVPDRDGVFRHCSELTEADAIDRYSLDGALLRGTPIVR